MVGGCLSVCILLVVFLVVLAYQVAEPACRAAELSAAVEAVRHGVLQLPGAQQLKPLPAVEREVVDIRSALGGSRGH